jgi:hypothetical protein
MRGSKQEPQDMAALAVLAAAAREAEELLAAEPELEKGTIDEANRRMKQFMRAAKQMAR